MIACREHLLKKNSGTIVNPSQLKKKWFEEIKLKKGDINEEEEEINIGDAFIFSAFLVHRSSINKSNKIRISLQFRYNDLSEKTYVNRGFPVNYKHAEPKKKNCYKKIS